MRSSFTRLGLHAVMVLDEAARELARLEIVLDRGRIALLRRAIAAGARRLHHDGLLLGHEEFRRLGRQRHFAAAGKLHEFAGAAAMAAEYAPGPVREALALAGERHGVADRAHHAAQPEPAAMLAGAA